VDQYAALGWVWLRLGGMKFWFDTGIQSEREVWRGVVPVVIEIRCGDLLVLQTHTYTFLSLERLIENLFSSGL